MNEEPTKPTPAMTNAYALDKEPLGGVGAPAIIVCVSLVASVLLGLIGSYQ